MWAYGAFVAGRLLVLGALVVLARVLTPEEFGLVALALVVIVVLDTVKDLGVTQALVVDGPGEDGERADTAWTIAVAVGVALALLTAAVSPLVADFFAEPGLVALLPLLAVNVPLRALASSHYAIAQRNLDFRTRTQAELADALVRGVASIALALAGFGAYSLVLGYLVGTLAFDAVLWTKVRLRLRPRIHRGSARRLVGFGSQLTGVDMMAAFNHNVDNAFIGRVLGTTSLGLYSIALRVPELAVRNLGVVAGQILFPAFTATQPEAVGRAFRVSLRLMVLISLPVSVALAVLAEPLVLAFFGDQWLGSIDALRVIAITAFASTVSVPAGSAYKAAGRGGLLLMLSVPRAVLLVFALVLFIDGGIVAVAICQAVITALMAVAGLVVARTVLGVGLRQSAGAMGVAVVPSAALGLAAAGAAALLDGTGAWPMLLGGSIAGGLAFLVTLRLTAPSVVTEVLGRVRGRRGSAETSAVDDHELS
jgi:PST family polysaccharide transporter